jgi:hypothetical protein
MADLEEAISVLREALDLLPSPSYLRRWDTLTKLITAHILMYGKTRTFSHLQELITHIEEEFLPLFQSVPRHTERAEVLRILAFLYKMRFDDTGQEEDLSKISALEKEANRLAPHGAFQCRKCRGLLLVPSHQIQHRWRI